ncbi:aldo/keto reductase [Archangium primigenium]|uniref:aldo/keto reductase n=1 Tax=[Archangium] primigenium TaxID=2792470 RepID=UPI00195893E2|nr:aldo/keto reductase [Archangium primigenium]MBM7118340.1 aldo/keto reductase [Archangium primigenium]
MTTMNDTRLGTQGPSVFPIALGCMGMGAGSWYGDSDEAESIATIHEAIERGVNVLDTGDFYSMGRNELLVGKAIRDRRDKVLLSVKFGALRGPDGAHLGYDARPAATKNALAHSLTRLGVDHIDIYRPARLDPNVPIEDTVGAIADLVKAGYVRHIALSEVGVETIRRAASVHPICDVQLEYALVSRSVEARILPVLHELGIAMTAYGVLSRGLLTGAKPTGGRDIRAHLPRFSADNAEKNDQLVDALARMAAKKGVSPAQLAIAWVRAKGVAQGVMILPTLGARTRRQLADTLSSLEVSLSQTEVAELEAAVPASQVAGTRYAAAGMATLDSER